MKVLVAWTQGVREGLCQGVCYLSGDQGWDYKTEGPLVPNYGLTCPYILWRNCLRSHR